MVVLNQRPFFCLYMLSKQVFVPEKNLCELCQISMGARNVAKELKIKTSGGHCPYIKFKAEISVEYLRLPLCVKLL